MSTLFLYIDPGSGSLLLQFIIGIALGISIFFKTIRYRIRAFFGGKKDEPEA
jgi:hypothetical protein